MRFEHVFIVVVTGALCTLPADRGRAEELTLNEALARAASSYPSLRAAELEIEAAEAEALQAGLAPNPEAVVEVENVAGSGALSGTDAAEYTLLLSQTLELGGKRARRRAVAVLEAAGRVHERDAARRELRSGVAVAWYEAAAAEEGLRLSRAMADTAAEIAGQARRRVAAGGAPALEATRAEIEAREARLSVEEAERDAASAAARLAAWCGLEKASIPLNHADVLYALQPLPSLEELAEALGGHPALAQARTAREQARARREAERAGGVADLNLGAGVRLEEESGDHAFVFEIGLPLPLIDRNQGARAAAAHRVEQAGAQEAAVRLDLRSLLIDARNDAANAAAAARALEEELLPASREAFEQARAGYAEGRYGALDLLEAERNLFAQQARYVEACAEYHRARIALHALAPEAVPLPDTENNEEDVP